MLSKEKNDVLTQAGADTPTGKVMRQYWIPAALSEELSGDKRIGLCISWGKTGSVSQ